MMYSNIGLSFRETVPLMLDLQQQMVGQIPRSLQGLIMIYVARNVWFDTKVCVGPNCGICSKATNVCLDTKIQVLGLIVVSVTTNGWLNTKIHVGLQGRYKYVATNVWLVIKGCVGPNCGICSKATNVWLDTKVRVWPKCGICSNKCVVRYQDPCRA